MNKQFELFGISIEIPRDKVETNAIRTVFDRKAMEIESNITKNFYSTFSDLDDLYARIDDLAADVCTESIEEALKFLTAHEIYDISEHQFFDNFMQKYVSWNEDFAEISDAYEEIVERTAALDSHRTERRLNRRQWVGYGSKKAVYDADGKNIVSNVGHGVFNLMAKGVTAISNSIKKGEIYKSPSTVKCVANGLKLIALSAGVAVVDAINAHKPGTAYDYSAEELQKAEAIVDNIKKDRIPNDRLLTTLIQAIEAYPYNRDIYVLLLQHFGGDNSRLDAVVSYFGHSDLETEKQRIFNIYLKDFDTSNLESLDTHLPNLNKFAQELGYTKFEKEAKSLRQSAAKKAFIARLASLNLNTHSEITASVDSLIVYAKKIDFWGYEAELQRILKEATAKDFTLEASKLCLKMPEDCDQHFKDLEAHAKKIDFSDFPDWAKRVRSQAEANAEKRLAETKLLLKEQSRKKNKKRAIIVYSLLFMFIGAIKGGIYLTDEIGAFNEKSVAPTPPPPLYKHRLAQIRQKRWPLKSQKPPLTLLQWRLKRQTLAF
jgi:hypothetical protein